MQYFVVRNCVFFAGVLSRLRILLSLFFISVFSITSRENQFKNTLLFLMKYGVHIIYITGRFK
jgi:hypothetical protein